jgi:hypothetical protein
MSLHFVSEGDGWIIYVSEVFCSFFVLLFLAENNEAKKKRGRESIIELRIDACCEQTKRERDLL